MMSLKHYLKQNAISFDQSINAILGGWADETLSARAYRLDVSGRCSWPRKVIDRIMFFDPDHCYTSYLAEKERRHSPPDEREGTGIEKAGE